MKINREWRAAILIALIAAAILQIPYALGYLFARPGTEYQGLLVNVEDFSYHAIMLQGYEGAWQYQIQFTPEAHAPAFIYGFYLALGHVARVIGISIVAAWHGALIAFALILFLALFGFIRLFISDLLTLFVAYLLALFGSGFDWFLFPFEPFDSVGVAPIDFRMPEAHLFYSALTYPHYSAGITLMLAAFYFARRAQDEKKIAFAFCAGVANLLLAIVFPFLILLTGGVLGADWVHRCRLERRILWLAARNLIIAFIIPLPLLFYYAAILQSNEIFRVWNAQATTLSPNPLHYLLAYGVMLALAVLSSRGVARNDTMLLWLWLFVVALLLYAPLGAQRRFVLGVQIPLAILAAIGITRVVLPRLQVSRLFRVLAARRGYSAAGLRRLLVVALLFFISSANFAILVRHSIFTAVEQPDAFFRARAEIAAMDWLRAHSARSDTVLGAYWTGSFIPARAGNRVFVGQRYETAFFDDKMRSVEAFFSASARDDWREYLLAQYRVAYVFYGPRERDLGAFDPARSQYLERAYANDQVTIYRVKP